MRMRILFYEMKAFLVLVSYLFYVGTSLDNGLGRKPQMGWNSWYHFYCSIDAQIVMDTADSMVIKSLFRHVIYAAVFLTGY